MVKEKHLGGKENKNVKNSVYSYIYISMIMYLDDLEVVIWQSCIWLTVNADEGHGTEKLINNFR